MKATPVMMALLGLLSLLPAAGADLRRTAVRFRPAGDEILNLEGEVVWLADETLPERRPGVVVCHPDPRYGGSMANHVVAALCQSLAETGYVALRFNFRGVGKSEGAFAEGQGEARDCAGALAYLRSLDRVDRDHSAVVGYSFGAAVALRIAVENQDLRACACLGFPLAASQKDLSCYNFARGLVVPSLFVSGTEDRISDVASIRRLLYLMGLQAEVAPLSGADHFLANPEHLRSAVLAVRDLLRAKLR